MGEWREFARLKQFSNDYRLKLLATFFVTIVFDLTVAVELGLVLAVVLFVRNQGAIFRAEPVARTEQQLTYRLYGPLFFGAVAKIDPIVAEVERSPAAIDVMLDASQMVSLDTTGLDALEQLHKAVHRRGGELGMVGLHPQPRSLIERSGFASRLGTCQ